MSAQLAEDPTPCVLAVTGRRVSEAFVQEELAEMVAQGLDLIIVPVRGRLAVASVESPTAMASKTLAEPLLSPRVLLAALAVLGRYPRRSIRWIAAALATSNGQRNLLANLLSMPKALWIARLVLKNRVTHIHAYWLGHTATVAMVASQIAGVPFSTTAYRWDIDAANCLAHKFRVAAFVRCADELGHRQLTEAARELTCSCPIVMVRTGVVLPSAATWELRPLHLTQFCCPGMFVEKKGHVILLRAFRRVLDLHPSARLHLFGEGPTSAALRREVAQLGLHEAVKFHGVVPLEELRAFLRSQRPVCVLPSIKATDGQEEGIPVALVEAMANGAPVISTRTGSIESLIWERCGILVEPNNVDALAEVLASLSNDPDRVARRCRSAAARLVGEYDLAHTAAQMISLLSGIADPKDCIERAHRGSNR